MKTLFLHTVMAILLAACPAPGYSQGDLLIHVDIPGYTISPNGDGLQDSLVATYTLADTAWSISAYILTPAPPQTIVDSLLIDAPKSAGTHALRWDGRDFAGVPAPEGTYSLLVQAFNGAHDDSVYKTIYIYLTPPSVSITRVEPGVFAPDILTAVPLMVADFTVTDSPPEDEDQIRIAIEDPSGKELVSLMPDSLFSGNGDYEVSWDGAEIAADGLYRIVISVTDNGGNTASDWSTINVDDKAPSLQAVNPINGATLQEIPASFSGWTWDRNGIDTDSLRISFSGVVFDPIISTTLVDDTVYFSVPLAESLTVEKQYVMLLQSQDVVGRETQISYRITFDATAPPPPALTQPLDFMVRKPISIVSGTISEEPDILRVFRNGELVDSLSGLIEEDFSLEVMLVPGINIFTALTVDEAGNVSPFSNSVEIVFNNSSGLFIPQPFQPGNEFQLNLARDARSIELRIYDLAGDLVQIIEESPDGTSVSIPWNGLNGDDKSIERGPLVLVAGIIYMDNETESQRKLFLFKP
jgi:hypothetical protein